MRPMNDFRPEQFAARRQRQFGGGGSAPLAEALERFRGRMGPPNDRDPFADLAGGTPKPSMPPPANDLIAKPMDLPPPANDLVAKPMYGGPKPGPTPGFGGDDRGIVPPQFSPQNGGGGMVPAEGFGLGGFNFASAAQPQMAVNDVQAPLIRGYTSGPNARRPMPKTPPSMHVMPPAPVNNF